MLLPADGERPEAALGVIGIERGARAR